MEQESTPTHILFIGAGAVGCFYASLCHHPSKNIYVSLVCRSNYETVLHSGVHLQTRSFGNYHFTPHQVYNSVAAAATSASAPIEGYDYVIITTKALPDLIDDSKDIDTISGLSAGSKTAIVIIQNGVGVEQAYRERCPLNPIVSGVTIVSAEKLPDGVIRQNRWTRISLGPYSDGYGGKTKETLELSQRGHASATRLARILMDYGKLRDAEVHNERHLQIIRWHKICINASMNPTAVLSGEIGNADMVQDSELHIHLKSCMDEVIRAIAVIFNGEALPNLATPDDILISTSRNKGAKPSMLLDWQQGKPMEIEVILGNPIRIARAHGVDMPRLQTLYALLKSASRMRAKT